MLRLVAFVLSVSSSIWVASGAQASPLPTLTVERLVELCADPNSSAESKSDAASELTFRDGIKLEGKHLDIALACLQSEFGTTFTYNGFSLYSPEFDAAAAEVSLAESAKNEQLAEAREAAYSSELTRICYAELATDRFRAMTTNACARIFIRDGLPD